MSTPTFLEFDTATFPAEARFAAWAAAMPYYKLATPDPLAFSARARAWMLPPVVVTDTRLTPTRFERTEELARADPADHVALQLVCTGQAAGNAQGRAFVALPGDIAIQETARPFDAVAGVQRSITVRLPRTFLEEKLGALDVHGLVLRVGEAPLLATFLAALPDALGSAEAEAPSGIAALLRDHLAHALRSVAARQRVSRRDRPLRERAVQHIERHLDDPLAIADLCDALGVSRSRLYRAFGNDGGIAAYVQQRRLSRLYALLSDPAETAPIAALAARHGFVDKSHFTRLFRRSFGCTPGRLRERALATAPREGSVQDRFNDWFAPD